MADLQTMVLDDVLVVYFPDHELMDESQNRRIGAELLELTSQVPAGKMLVSFRGVDFVTSSMLGQLVMFNKRCLSQDIALKICEVGSDLRMIFRIVRLDTLVEICGDESSAMNAFHNGGCSASLEALDKADEHRAAAEAGDSASQYALARCYESGHGVPQDFQEALKWYERAAAAGHATAQHTLGTWHAYGMQVPQDYQQAFGWFMKAAEQGHPNSQYMLGVSYSHGLAGTQDHAQAAGWYLRAAEAGDVDAQAILADCYLEGRGVEPDEAAAIRWLTTAAERGNADAQANLAWFYASGQGVAEDRNEAVRLYRLAAAQGHQGASEALLELGET